MAAGSGRVEVGLDIFDTAPVGAVVTSGPTHVLSYINPAARSVIGELPLGEPIGPVPEALIDLHHHRDLLAQVHETGERAFLGEVPIESAGSERRWFDLAISPIDPARVDPGVLIILSEATDRILQAEQIQALGEERYRISTRYSTLGKLASQLVFVTDPEGAVVEPSPGWEAVTGQPFEEFRGEGWAEMLHPSDREPTRQAWQQALTEVPSSWERVYRLHTVDGGYRHFKARAVPVKDAEGRVREWVGTCTDIEHDLAVRRSERLLARAATAVAGTSRLDEMFTSLAQVIVPEVADACRVYTIRDTPNRPPGDLLTVERTATVIREGLPEYAARLQEQRGRQSPLGRAVSSRRAVYTKFPPGEPPADVGPQALRRWLVDAEANCLVSVPIVVDGVVAAAASVSVCGDRPPIGEDDVALIRLIFERAHDALSNAMAFRRTQQFALAIQHSLLTEPPDIPGLEVAARYQSTVLTAGVGGDWYDCFVLPDGSTVLSIGDVAGHDLPAAVTMGQIRTILRGLALGGSESPDEVLRLLNWAMETLYEESTATCALVRIEQDHGQGHLLHYALAGHPPPLLVSREGNCRFLNGGRNPLLGVLPCERPFHFAEEPLPPGSTLLLYTDGLVEHRGENIDVGLARLCGQAATVATESVDTLCDKLLTDLPISGQDDVAMIGVRLSES